MAALVNTKLFRELGLNELKSLEQISQTRTFQASQIIFKEGDQGDGLYVIESGTVQILASLGQEQPRILSRLGPGDFFGEMSLLDNEPRSAAAAAETESRLSFFPREKLLRILENSPQLVLSLVREVSLRLREFNRHYVREMIQAERLSLVGRFARSIVHDFKNPLAIINFAADLGALNTATLEMRQTARGRIRRQVDRLGNMINELLEFTRGSASTVQLALVNYAAFVTQMIEEIQPEISDKSVVIVCKNPPPAIHIMLDPRRLTHVFFNLIHNAVDVMPDGGKIVLRFIILDNDLITEIEDTGPGIDPDIIGQVFEPFVTRGKAHGTGLGLSICKRIIQDHNGQIHARNQPGQGAVFLFSLPITSHA